MLKRKIIFISLCLIISLGLSTISAADVDNFSTDYSGTDDLVTDDLVTDELTIDNYANENIGNLNDEETLKSVEDNTEIEYKSHLIEDNAIIENDMEDRSDDNLKSEDEGKGLSDGVTLSKTYVELNSYDISSNNPHSVNIYDDSDYVAIIHAPSESDGTAHLLIGDFYDNATEIFSCSIQALDKEIDVEDNNYSYFYLRFDHFMPEFMDYYDVPHVYYVKVEYRKGLTSLLYGEDEGYVKFVEDSDHVKVIAPPEIVIGDSSSSYIGIFVEGTLGNLRVLIDGNEVLNDSVFNLRYINETNEFYYIIPVFLDDLTIGTHTYNVTYYDGNWANVTISDTIDVTYLFNVYPQIEYNMEDYPFYDPTPVLYGDNVSFTIILPDDATSQEIKVNGKSYEILLSYGLANLTLSDFELGQNILNFTYNDPNYGEKSLFLVLDIASLYIPDIVPSGSAEGIKLRLPSDNQGKLNISIWDEENFVWHLVDAIDVVDGKADYSFDDFPWTIGTHDILVEFNGGNYSFTNESSITIIPNIEYNNISIGQNSYIFVSMVGLEGKITVFVNGENLTTVELDYFGKAFIPILSEKLNVGKNIIALEYEGNESVFDTFYYYDLNIGDFVPYEYELWVSPLYSSNTENTENMTNYVLVIMPEGTSGNVTVYANGEAFSTTPVQGGLNQIKVPYGNDNFTLIFTGDDGVTYEIGADIPTERTAKDLQDLIDNAEEGSVVDLGNFDYLNISNVNITKDISIIGHGATITGAGDGSPIFNILPKSQGGPDEVNITNINFFVNNTDIVVKAIADNCTNGVSIDVANINIRGNTISAIDENVVTESVTILVLESERSILSPTGTINISSNYIDAGIDSFMFKVTDIISGNDVQIHPQNITFERKASWIDYKNMTTTAVDVDTDGRVGKYFYITLKDKEGNLLKNKPVQIGFNGNVYDRTTDNKGQAKLQINLKNAGTYTFAVSFLSDDEYNGSFVVAKIVVSKQKGSLTVPNKSYKASATTKSLTATFKSASGKVVKGKKITFTVNGKSYSATTNAKGVATVKVSLNTKGTYSFTAKFAGNNMYAAITKTAKLKIT